MVNHHFVAGKMPNLHCTHQHTCHEEKNGPEGAGSCAKP